MSHVVYDSGLDLEIREGFFNKIIDHFFPRYVFVREPSFYVIDDNGFIAASSPDGAIWNTAHKKGDNYDVFQGSNIL